MHRLILMMIFRFDLCKKFFLVLALALPGELLMTTAFCDSGDVRLINYSTEMFVLHCTLPHGRVTECLRNTSIGLPTAIPSNSDQNYRITLIDTDVGKKYEYTSTTTNNHFSIDIKSMQNFVDHHTTVRTIEYLSVNWENILQQSSNIHYVLPLFWNNSNSMDGQPVRVDTNNNALIGIFSQKPTNAITIMSYNTDKDGTGSDHNSKYNNISDIINLFSQNIIPTPDVLMIQEGLGAQNLATYQQALSKIIPGNWYGYYATEGDRADSNIILVSPQYNTNHIQAGTLVFQNQCGWGFIGKRNAVYVDIPIADITQTATPGNLRIFNTHLESGKDSDIFLHAAQVRFAQFNEIVNYPRDNVAGMIIGGDFNTMPIFDDITGLTRYQLGDFLSVFDNYLGDRNINWGQPITCTWSTCADYTLHTGMWLDRLFTNNLSTPEYQTYALYPFVAHQADGYSDHLPVWITIYYEPTASSVLSLGGNQNSVSPVQAKTHN